VTLAVRTRDTNMSVEIPGFEGGTSRMRGRRVAVSPLKSRGLCSLITARLPPTNPLHRLALGLSASNEAALRGKMAPLPLPQNQNVYFATVSYKEELGDCLHK
jgi:hypothetical protein